MSIYGRSPDEWDKLAAWVIDNKLVSHVRADQGGSSRKSANGHRMCDG